jgi:hypothetical protein
MLEVGCWKLDVGSYVFLRLGEFLPRRVSGCKSSPNMKEVRFAILSEDLPSPSGEGERG